MKTTNTKINPKSSELLKCEGWLPTPRLFDMVPRPALLEPKAGLQYLFRVVTSLQIWSMPSRMRPWCCLFWVSTLLQGCLELFWVAVFWVHTAHLDRCLFFSLPVLIPSRFPGPWFKFLHRHASVKCMAFPHGLQRAAWFCRVLVNHCFLTGIQFVWGQGFLPRMKTGFLPHLVAKFMLQF